MQRAKDLRVEWKLYVFYDDDTKNVGIVFNNFYELSGLIAGGQYDPADSLSDSQKVCVNALVTKAYDNWTQIIEYDRKGLLSIEQTKQPNASQSDVALSRQDFPTSFDLQRSLRVPLILVPPSQPLIASGLIITEEIDEMLESEDMQLLHPTFSIDNHHSVNGTENMHLLYSPCFFFPSAMYNLELDDHTPLPVTDHNQDEEYHNVFDFLTKNYNSDEDHYGSSRKAVIGWLKMKAAMRWGTFIRKKSS